MPEPQAGTLTQGTEQRQGKRLWLKRSFYPYGRSVTSSTTSPSQKTHAPCEGTQLTSRGRVCLPKPTRCWVEEPSKHHSSSATIPSPQLSNRVFSGLEMHRDTALSRRLCTATCQDTQTGALLCRAGAGCERETSPGLVAAVRDGFPGAASLLCHTTALSDTSDMPALPSTRSEDRSLQLL